MKKYVKKGNCDLHKVNIKDSNPGHFDQGSRDVNTRPSPNFWEPIPLHKCTFLTRFSRLPSKSEKGILSLLYEMNYESQTLAGAF